MFFHQLNNMFHLLYIGIFFAIAQQINYDKKTSFAKNASNMQTVLEKYMSYIRKQTTSIHDFFCSCFFSIGKIVPDLPYDLELSDGIANLHETKWKVIVA